MRARRAPQRSLFDAGYPDHDMGRVLALMSRLLDEHLAKPGTVIAATYPQAYVRQLAAKAVRNQADSIRREDAIFEDRPVGTS